MGDKSSSEKEKTTTGWKPPELVFGRGSSLDALFGGKRKSYAVEEDLKKHAKGNQLGSDDPSRRLPTPNEQDEEMTAKTDPLFVEPKVGPKHGLDSSFNQDPPAQSYFQEPEPPTMYADGRKEALSPDSSGSRKRKQSESSGSGGAKETDSERSRKQPRLSTVEEATDGMSIDEETRPSTKHSSSYYFLNMPTGNSTAKNIKRPIPTTVPASNQNLHHSKPDTAFPNRNDNTWNGFQPDDLDLLPIRVGLEDLFVLLERFKLRWITEKRPRGVNQSRFSETKTDLRVYLDRDDKIQQSSLSSSGQKDTQQQQPIAIGISMDQRNALIAAKIGALLYLFPMLRLPVVGLLNPDFKDSFEVELPDEAFEKHSHLGNVLNSNSRSSRRAHWPEKGKRKASASSSLSSSSRSGTQILLSGLEKRHHDEIERLKRVKWAGIGILGMDGTGGEYSRVFGKPGPGLSGTQVGIRLEISEMSKTMGTGDGGVSGSGGDRASFSPTEGRGWRDRDRDRDWDSTTTASASGSFTDANANANVGTNNVPGVSRYKLVFRGPPAPPAFASDSHPERRPTNPYPESSSFKKGSSSAPDPTSGPSRSSSGRAAGPSGEGGGGGSTRDGHGGDIEMDPPGTSSTSNNIPGLTKGTNQSSLPSVSLPSASVPPLGPKLKPNPKPRSSFDLKSIPTGPSASRSQVGGGSRSTTTATTPKASSSSLPQNPPDSGSRAMASPVPGIRGVESSPSSSSHYDFETLSARERQVAMEIESLKARSGNSKPSVSASSASNNLKKASYVSPASHPQSQSQPQVNGMDRLNQQNIDIFEQLQRDFPMSASALAKQNRKRNSSSEGGGVGESIGVGYNNNTNNKETNSSGNSSGNLGRNGTTSTSSVLQKSSWPPSPPASTQTPTQTPTQPLTSHNLTSISNDKSSKKNTGSTQNTSKRGLSGINVEEYLPTGPASTSWMRNAGPMKNSFPKTSTASTPVAASTSATPITTAATASTSKTQTSISSNHPGPSSSNGIGNPPSHPRGGGTTRTRPTTTTARGRALGLGARGKPTARGIPKRGRGIGIGGSRGGSGGGINGSTVGNGNVKVGGSGSGPAAGSRPGGSGIGSGRSTGKIDLSIWNKLGKR